MDEGQTGGVGERLKERGRLKEATGVWIESGERPRRSEIIRDTLRLNSQHPEGTRTRARTEEKRHARPCAYQKALEATRQMGPKCNTLAFCSHVHIYFGKNT